MDSTVIETQRLRQYCIRLFEQAGVPTDEAIINVDSLIEADLTGVESHGVSLIPLYLKRLRAGQIRPQMEIQTITEGLSTAVIDAGNSLGASVSYRVMEKVIEKAKQTGIAFVTVKHSNHYGAAAYWPKMAAQHNMIGFTGTNAPSRMAPWGGTKPYFGTNPFAVAIPAGDRPPLVIDMATSVVARSKIRLAAKKNEPIPAGWAQTETGSDTTDANAALAGTILPFGGPKGSAIATIVEVLSGLLAGAVFATGIGDLVTDFTRPANVSHYFGAINIEAFVPTERFKQDMDQLIAEMKSNPPRAGVSEVLVPGERGWRCKERYLQTGIPLSGLVFGELKREGEFYNLDLALD